MKIGKIQKKKSKIERIAKETLEELFTRNSNAKGLFDQAYGFAVFNNIKVAFGFSGGGGSGVAVELPTGKRIYMKMGTGGLSLGLGAQKYQVVFLFQDRRTFYKFIDTGWEAEASANAVAGTVGANAEATFTNGMAVYQLTGGGLMLQADIAGTKYWKSKKLNRN